MILQQRPHFHLRDGAIWFLNAQRPLPPLSDAAHDMFARLQQDGPLSDPIPPEAAAELADRGLADLIVPVTKTDRRRVLVIEPHGDDAALSIGGVMWQRRHDLAFTLATCASHSNYTSSFHTGRDFFDRDTVSGLRRAEGEIFMAHLGGDYRVLDLPEATMRYADEDWSPEFFRAHRTSVAINNNRRASGTVLARWIEAVTPFVTDPSFEEIWLPLGAGTHSDHDLARNAVLSVLINHPQVMSRATVRLYKDVPYGTDFPDHTTRLLQGLRQAGAILEEDTVDVTTDFTRKMDLLGIFASQFKPTHVAGGVARSAAVGAPPGQKVEHLWHMTKAPDALDTFGLFIETPAALDVRDTVRRWCQGGAEVKRLRVLALAASGGWVRDEELLRATFPNARITVYASPATRAEIADRKSPDVVLRDVGRGSRSWALLALRLSLAPPAHTLFVAGDRLDTARHLSRLWPLGRSLTVRSMDHFALAVQ